MKTIYLIAFISLASTMQIWSTSLCSNGQLSLSITFDNNPEDVGWEIKDINNNYYAFKTVGSYTNQTAGSTIIETIPVLADGDYVLVMIDAGINGLCCSNGNGSYSLSDGFSSILSGNSYQGSEVTQFCVNQSNGDIIDTQAPSPTTVSISSITSNSIDISWTASADNIGTTDYGLFLNGIYIGNSTAFTGTLPILTPNTNYDLFILARDLIGNFSTFSNIINFTTPGSGTTVTTIIHEGYFENGPDGWIDGGNDCRRVSSNKSYEGNYSFRIRDNSLVSSSMTSSDFDLTGFDEVDITFEYYAKSMEVGEDFLLEFYQNGNWVILDSYVSGVEFIGDGFNSATFNLSPSSYNFEAANKFRLRCDASGNRDKIFIDAVIISETSTSSSLTYPDNNILAGSNFWQDVQAITTRSILTTKHQIERKAFTISPNPSRNSIHIEIGNSKVQIANIYNSQGQLVAEHQYEKNIDIQLLQEGIYILAITLENGERLTRQFIKSK